MKCYDTKEGIEESITSMSKFLKLIEDRHEAGYDRKERLQEWSVLGRWHMDSSGNVGQYSGFIPAETIPHLISAVMTREECFEAIKTYDKIINPDVLSDEEMKADDFDWANNKRSYPTSITISAGYNIIPPANIICPICRLGWTMNDCHDSYPVSKSNLVKDIVEGMRLSDFKIYLNNRFVDTKVIIPFSRSIHNQRYVDMSIREGYSFPTNTNGSIDVDESTYHLKDGDSVYVNEFQWFHNNCHLLNKDLELRQKFSEIFQNAGYSNFTLDAIPNQYGPQEYFGPWYNVKTPYGSLVIGWRKRVINIEFNDMKFKKSLPDFSKEDVTHDRYMVHAWGWDKAQTYLGKILHCCF